MQLSKLLCIALAFSLACGNRDQAKDQAPSSEVSSVENTKYGGMLRINYSQKPESFFPLSITSAVASQIATQVYEGLFKLNPRDLSVEPCLARSWNWSEDRKTLTILLKEGVFFHKNQCFKDQGNRELVANDVVFTFTQMSTPSSLNNSYHLIEEIIEGSKEYYQAQLDGKYEVEFKGVEALSRYEVAFHLNEPNSMFLSFLARVESSIFPQEAFDFHGLKLSKEMVGTGPFQQASINHSELLLARNTRYHQKDKEGNPLPYIAGVSIQFIQDKKAELIEFKNGKLDLVYMFPPQYLTEVLKDEATEGPLGYSHFEIQRTHELSTEILGMNLQHPLFSNVNFRKAIAFAIDRKSLLEEALNGGGYEASYASFIPEVNRSLEIEDSLGYAFNLDSAKFYLRKAGYERATDVPVLNLSVSSSGNNSVKTAVLIKDQLKASLGIDVNINIESFNDFIDKLIKGKLSLYRMGWSAEFPSKGEFLSVFQSSGVPENRNDKSFPNVSRYVNPNFDLLYDEAIQSVSDSLAMAKFEECEKVIMEDCAVVVLWFREGYQILQPTVKNLPINPIQYRDYREVYFSKPELLKSS